VTHDLPRLDLPVLLIVGDEDSKFQAIAREMESSLPNARVVILPAAGHAAHLEAPEAFVTEVSKFFAAQEAERDQAEAE
jgi:2-succinyl-6-hydroxy-2,4-cyclohexadiene-1-carboxylate synthase